MKSTVTPPTQESSSIFSRLVGGSDDERHVGVDHVAPDRDANRDQWAGFAKQSGAQGNARQVLAGHLGEVRDAIDRAHHGMARDDRGEAVDVDSAGSERAAGAASEGEDN